MWASSADETQTSASRAASPGRRGSERGGGKKVRFFSRSAGKILVGTVIESDADYHTVSYRGSNGKERVKRARREDCEEPF